MLSFIVSSTFYTLLLELFLYTSIQYEHKVIYVRFSF